jgi:hypothetical protein
MQRGSPPSGGECEDGADFMASLKALNSRAQVAPAPGAAAPSDASSCAADAVVTLGGARQPAPPAPAPRPASTVPLGLSAFACTCFVISVANAGLGFTKPDIVIGLALFFGGLVQLLAGQWALAAGDVFAGTVFSAYSAFWLSWAYIAMPASGALAAYADAREARNAVGVYLVAWSLLTFVVTLAARRSNAALFATLCFLSATFPLLAAGSFAAPGVGGPNALTQAGGWAGFGCAFGAWYTMASILVTEESAGFALPNAKLR